MLSAQHPPSSRVQHCETKEKEEAVFAVHLRTFPSFAPLIISKISETSYLMVNRIAQNFSVALEGMANLSLLRYG